MTEDEMVAALEAVGVHVAYLPLPVSGQYWHHQSLIVVDVNQSQCAQRCALAHELIHQRCAHDGPQSPDVEAWVDRQAARLLVSPAEYAVAETLYGADVWAIADELNVEPWVIDAYQSCLRDAA